MLVFWVSKILVPTPSVEETSTGFFKPIDLRSNKPPNPPKEEITPGLRVLSTNGPIFLTNLFPALISTPELL